MRTGVTRDVLRREVQIEAGISTAAGHTVQMDERINHLLNRMERMMAVSHTWPTLTWEQEVTIPANAQFATLPSNITFTDIRDVRVMSGSLWLKLVYGIGPAERSLYNTTQRASPTMRWEIEYPGTTTFEVWPISPVAETLRFFGTRTVGAMTTDASTCILDGDALVLLTAAELLVKQSAEEAAIKQAAAAKRIRMLLMAQVGQKIEPVNMGRRTTDPVLRPWIDYIPPEG